MTVEELRELLRLAMQEGGISLPRVAKRMALSQSQLNRYIAVAGGGPGVIEGLGFVELQPGDPPRLYTTAAGRNWLS